MDTKALRQKILDLAIRGKLVPQDPNDEPASVLLERIREEKKQMVEDGRLKKKDIKNDTIIYRGDDNLHYEKFQDGTVKCIEDEIPFEVPEGWEWCRLGNLALYKKGPFGSSITKAMFVPDSPENIKIYEQKNAIGKDASLGEYFITPEKYESLKGFEVKPGDIIVSCAGTIGETYILPPNMRKGIINQALMRISMIDEHIIEFYLTYFDFVLKDNAKNQGHGIALSNIPALAVLKNYLIPIPPLIEQERILSRLNHINSFISEIEKDKLFLSQQINITKSKILDLAIQGKLVPQNPEDEPASVLLERIRAEKEELIKAGKIKRDKKESIIYRGDDNSYYRIKNGVKRCIDSELPFQDIPNGWTWVMLPEIVFFQEGPGILKKDFRDKGIPLIRISGLQSEKVLLDGCNYLDVEMVEQKWKHFKLNEGDVILCSSASIGKASIVGAEAVGAIPYTGQIRFKMTEVIDRDYFLYLAMSKVYLDQINSMKTGNCIQHYGPTHLREIYVPLPPKAEQLRIVDSFKNAAFLLEHISNNL